MTHLTFERMTDEVRMWRYEVGGWWTCRYFHEHMKAKLTCVVGGYHFRVHAHMLVFVLLCEPTLLASLRKSSN